MPVNPLRIQKFHLFAELGPLQLQETAAFCEVVKAPKGSLLFSFGDSVNGFYLVEEGKIKIFRGSVAGREQILHIVEKNHSFAEVAVFSMETYPASAMTLTDSILIKVPKNPFLKFLHRFPDVTKDLLSGQAQWLQRMVDLMSCLLLSDVPSRISRYLLMKARDERLELEDGIALETGKKHLIAAHIGTIPETLSRSLVKLEKQGLIRREGSKIRLLDIDRLLSLAYPGDFES